MPHFMSILDGNFSSKTHNLLKKDVRSIYLSVFYYGIWDVRAGHLTNGQKSFSTGSQKKDIVVKLVGVS